MRRFLSGRHRSGVWSSVEKRWSVQLRIAAVELSIKIQSLTATQRGFR